MPPPAEKSKSEKTLCGKRFVFGSKGFLRDQLTEFVELVTVVDGRFEYSTDSKLLVRYKSFRWGSGDGRNPVLPGSNGYCYVARPVSLNELKAFVDTNRAIGNINWAYECIAGEVGVLDIASCVAFDLDAKNDPSKSHRTVIDKFKALGWTLGDDSLLREEPFLDFVLPKLVAFLTELWELRGTPLEPPLTLKDFYVSNSCKPYVEERKQSILERGRLSFHAIVPRLMFANQADRTAFKQACLQLLPQALQATVDTSVYDKNSNMRVLGHQKDGGMPLMPYSRGGMYGDDVEYATPFDIPASVTLMHTWSFVPPDARRLFTDETMARFAKKVVTQKAKASAKTSRKTTATNDERAAAAVAVYEAFCSHWNTPFNKSDYNISYLEAKEDDSYDYAVYLEQLPGRSRTCPLGAAHTSNHAKLVVRGSAVYYFCFSKPRGGGKVRTTDGDEFDVLRNVQRKHCCEVHVGELPHALFEYPADLVREPRIVNGVRREAPLSADVLNLIKDKAALKDPTVDRVLLETLCFIIRSMYASGKTVVLTELIAQVLTTYPNAKILYVANTQNLVREKAEEITATVNKLLASVRGQALAPIFARTAGATSRDAGLAGGKWKMAHYVDDNATCSSSAVAICSQSAPKFACASWDLVIFDELNGQLSQLVGLDKENADGFGVLCAMLELARKAQICACADANADRDAIDFLTTAGRIPVILDTPDCDAFKGKELEVRAVVEPRSYKVHKNATYQHVVDTIMATDGQVAVACAIAKSVQTLAVMLRERGLPVLATHGKDSDRDKRRFTRSLCNGVDPDSYVDHAAGVHGPNVYFKVLLYSPAVTGGLSNHTCVLQLGIWSKHGPSLEQFIQQLKRCRDAPKTVVWLLEDELLRATAPRLVCMPQESVLVTPELELSDATRSKQVLQATFDFQAMLRHHGAKARRYAHADAEADATANDIGGSVTLDTVYTKPVKVGDEEHTFRMQLMPAPPAPTREDVENAECAVDVFAEELSVKEAGGVLANHDELVHQMRKTRYTDGPRGLFERLKASVELERLRRAAYTIPVLRADCERLGMRFSVSVFVADEDTVERANTEVSRCFVVHFAELVLAEILFYAECMHGRGLSTSHEMVVLHATEGKVATKSAPGEGDIRATTAIRRRALELLRGVIGDASECFTSATQLAPDESDYGLEDGGDTYLSHKIAEYLTVFDDAVEESELPPLSHDVTVLLCKRLWCVLLSFGEANIDRFLPTVYHGLRRLLKQGLTKPEDLKDAEALLSKYFMLFRRDLQAKFRNYVSWYTRVTAGEDEDTIYFTQSTAFMEGECGKRRKLEPPMLICAANDVLRKAGVAAGLRAGPDDERRVLLKQTAEKVKNRTLTRHRLPPWQGEAVGERDEKVARSSQDVAAICDGPLGTRMALKKSGTRPMERFLEVLNACLVPLYASWDTSYPKDSNGYKKIKLHQMLHLPWVGAHAAAVNARWSSFWRAVMEEKNKTMGEKAKDRHKNVERALLALRQPSADGRRWLYAADEPQEDGEATASDLMVE